jgi:hypothetical protein
MILQHTIVKHYKDQLTIRINPKYINGYVGSNITKFANSPNKFLSSASRYFWPSGAAFERFSPFKVYSFVIRDRHYTKPVHVDSLKKFKKVNDLITKKEDYSSSIWYNDLYSQLKSDGFAKHKDHRIGSKEELDSFFENYVLKLVHSMNEKGYDHSIDQDVANIMIGKNGEIHKSNAGDHRFFIAKIVDAPIMPFKIKGVHESFMEAHDIPDNRHGIKKLIQVIEDLEHQYSTDGDL